MPTEDLSWTSSNEAVATVDGGNVSAVGTGHALIHATMLNEGVTQTADCVVVVPEGWQKAPTWLQTKLTDDGRIELTWEHADAENVPSAYVVCEIIDGMEYQRVNVSGIRALLNNVSEGKHTYLVRARERNRYAVCERRGLCVGGDSSLEDFGLSTLKSFPTIGAFFKGAEIGAKVGLAIDDKLLNVDECVVAMYHHKCAVEATTAYLPAFEAAYERFMSNPTSEENYKAFYEAANTYSKLVSIEWAAFMDVLTQTDDFLLSKIKGSFMNLDDKTDKYIAVAENRASWYRTELLYKLDVFKCLCDGGEGPVDPWLTVGDGTYDDSESE